MASQVALVVKNLPANAGDVRDVGSIPRSGRFPGVGNGSPLQYSCLENPMDRGAWRAAVHGVTKSRTRLSDIAQCTSHRHVLVGSFQIEGKKRRKTLKPETGENALENKLYFLIFLSWPRIMSTHSFMKFI